MSNLGKSALYAAQENARNKFNSYAEIDQLKEEHAKEVAELNEQIETLKAELKEAKRR